MDKNYKKMSYDNFIKRTIILTIIIIGIIFSVYAYFIQSDSIKQGLKNDKSVTVELIFQNLFTAMKSGYDKEQLDKLVSSLETNIPNSSISIIHNENETDSKNIKNVFQSKESIVFRNEKNVGFAKPIIFRQECISCHTNNIEGEVASVVYFDYPLMDLTISLKDILAMFLVLFVISIIVIFIIWYIFVKSYFLVPIKNLVNEMVKIENHKDLNKKTTINCSIKEINEIEKVFNEQNQKLLDSYNNLEHISSIDCLTKIFNRKKFEELSHIEISKVKRYDYAMSLLLIDLNKFKFINDTYGHDVGDEVLIKFTEITKDLIREGDILFRIGGDEFIIILPHTKTQEAKKVIEKIKDKFKEYRLKKDTYSLEISLSIGVSEYKIDGEAIKELLKVADERMYQDKLLKS